MNYLSNCWYQVAWAAELTPQSMLRRVVLETPVLLFRDQELQPRALLDRCPHRFAPLSAGRFENGEVTCRYHGLRFDGSGRCTANPHGPTAAARARAFPIMERHKAIWIWLGDAEPDDHKLPDLSFIDAAHPNACVFGLMPTEADYLLLIDNLMDLSHIDFLHPATLGGMLTNVKPVARKNVEGVTIDYHSPNCDAPPSFQPVVPSPAKADMWLTSEWFPPALVIVSAAAQPAGVANEPLEMHPALHSVTPQTASTSLYFYCVIRRNDVDNEELTHRQRAMIEQAFNLEDKPMVEHQQRSLGKRDIMSMNPALLQSDLGSVLVRRKLSALIEQELGCQN